MKQTDKTKKEGPSYLKTPRKDPDYRRKLMEQGLERQKQEKPINPQ